MTDRKCFSEINKFLSPRQLCAWPGEPEIWIGQSGIRRWEKSTILAVINVRKGIEVWDFFSLETALNIHEKELITVETVVDYKM